MFLMRAAQLSSFCGQRSAPLGTALSNAECAYAAVVVAFASSFVGRRTAAGPPPARRVPHDVRRPERLVVQARRRPRRPGKPARRLPGEIGIVAAGRPSATCGPGLWSHPPWQASARLGAADGKLHSSISRDKCARGVASAQELPLGTEAAISRDIFGSAVPAFSRWTRPLSA